ncbi:J domain-containing protein C2E1P5.03 [Phlyctema vagabunda]|uniref:J domain-containing protein C2E1P5.03 n=1 Tax=Phlyctema vagabunda TaxID=108571 RepID=A0ABR4P3R8_9HELO
MRLSTFALGILACLLTVVAAWSKEDQEIFRLRDEVATSEGPEVTFYEFLGIKPSASHDQITQAYRERSRVLHPDKVKHRFIASKSTGKDKKSKSKKPGVHVSKGPSQAEIDATIKVASDRYARLGVVVNILKGPGRERYDHFLSNGFPKWKGTGYYYARFRPGLGTVLTALFISVGGGGHWLALYLGWKRQQEFVGRYIRFARHAAWGDNLNIPGLDTASSTPAASGADVSDPSANMAMNRRQRRMQEKDTKKDKGEKKPKAKRASPTATPPSDVTGPKKRVVAENGKILVVDSVGNVYLEQANEEGETQEFLLDPDELSPPSIKDTALYRFPVWVFNRGVGRFFSKSPVADDSSEEGGEHTPSSSDAEDFEVLEKVKTTAQNGNGKSSKKTKKSSKGR